MDTKISVSIALPGNALDKKSKALRYKSVKQVINMSDEAYDNFVGNEKPYGYKGTWATLSPAKKVSWHLNRIAESMGGNLISYQILN